MPALAEADLKTRLEAARIERMEETSEPWMLRGNPPVSTCTICAGKKDIGREKHFGIVRGLDSDPFYRGQ